LCSRAGEGFSFLISDSLFILSQTKKIKTSDLTKVGAALQKQAIKDVAPIWEVKASVDVFDNIQDVPIGYWPVMVMDQIDDPSAVCCGGL